MGGVAVVFPGQGTQKDGMAKDFVEEFPEARRVFDAASEVLELSMDALCFGGDPRLNLTEFTQPAILTAEIAMFRALEAHHGFAPRWFGGHSLGEYTALVAAGVIPLADAVRLVRARGRLMQTAVEPGAGAMAAVTLNPLDVEIMGDIVKDLQVDLANHNSPAQVVMSGAAAAVEEACGRLAAHPDAAGARITRLNVSAPFHSRMMRVIEADFRMLLADAASRWSVSGASRVLCNVGGGFHEADAERIVDALTRQISGTVRWVDNMRTLVAEGPDQIVEVGPKRPLRGFFRGLDTAVDAVTNLVSARRAMGAG